MKKLLKNEYKSTYRFFLGVIIIFVALVIMERMSLLGIEHFGEEDGIVGTISKIIDMAITLLAVFGTIIFIFSPFVYGIIRFYKNLLSDEGYLSFTLPVTVDQHIWSKLIVAFTWAVILFIIGIITAVLFIMSINMNGFIGVMDVVKNGMSMWYGKLGGWLVLFFISFFIGIISEILNSFMLYYASMSVGQSFNRHKIIMSCLIYLGFNTVRATIGQMFQLIFAIVGEDQIEKYVNALNGIDFSSRVSDENAIFALQFLMSFIVIGIVVNIINMIINYLISKYCLTKKLNLS